VDWRAFSLDVFDLVFRLLAKGRFSKEFAKETHEFSLTQPFPIHNRISKRTLYCNVRSPAISAVTESRFSLIDKYLRMMASDLTSTFTELFFLGWRAYE